MRVAHYLPVPPMLFRPVSPFCQGASAPNFRCSYALTEPLNQVVEHLFPLFQGLPEIPPFCAMDLNLKVSGVVINYAAEHFRLFVIHFQLSHGAPPLQNLILIHKI